MTSQNYASEEIRDALINCRCCCDCEDFSNANISHFAIPAISLSNGTCVSPGNCSVYGTGSNIVWNALSGGNRTQFSWESAGPNGAPTCGVIGTFTPRFTMRLVAGGICPLMDFRARIQDTSYVLGWYARYTGLWVGGCDDPQILELNGTPHAACTGWPSLITITPVLLP